MQMTRTSLCSIKLTDLNKLYTNKVNINLCLAKIQLSIKTRLVRYSVAAGCHTNTTVAPPLFSTLFCQAVGIGTKEIFAFLGPFNSTSVQNTDKISGLDCVTQARQKSTMEGLELVSSNKIFGGHQKVYSHESSELKCKMNFSVYLPPQAECGDVKLPVIFYLSGLTCSEQNFISKSGFQRYAAEHGIVVVGPDTSPRGVKIPGDDDSWDFGVAAGFYLDATKEPWSKHYKMGSYVNKELYELVLQAFSNVIDAERVGIMGHSMGGHGALVSTLRNPGLYKSVSAFAPICNPMECPWGVKVFNGYLGEDKRKWAEWDATELVKKYDGPPLTLLIDQGSSDKFYLEKQLLPENLVEACRSVGVPVILNLREGYDHSYYYISTYIGEHFDFHAKILKA